MSQAAQVAKYRETLVQALTEFGVCGRSPSRAQWR
jgi:hypothetical protein